MIIICGCEMFPAFWNHTKPRMPPFLWVCECHSQAQGCVAGAGVSTPLQTAVSCPGPWWDPAFLTQVQAWVGQTAKSPSPHPFHLFPSQNLTEDTLWVGVSWERAVINPGEEFKG